MANSLAVKGDMPAETYMVWRKESGNMREFSKRGEPSMMDKQATGGKYLKFKAIEISMIDVRILAVNCKPSL